jgi:hypothetical protein
VCWIKPNRKGLKEMAPKAKYQVEFNYTGHIANTLHPSDIGTNASGWTIEGEIHEDWFEWVNDFEAKKGNWRVWGNFETVVYATSEKAYNDFVKHHPPHEWDYWDI